MIIFSEKEKVRELGFPYWGYMGMCVSVVFRGEGVCVCVISFKALGFGFVFVFQFSKPLESTLKLQYWMMRERERETETELCVFGFGIIFDGGEEGMGIEEERMAHGIE